MTDHRVSITQNRLEFSKANQEYPLIEKFPNAIMVEITNACNLKCVMCYHKYMKRKIGFMSEELFIKIVNEAKELGIQNMGLYTTGEAFLHPKIFDFIKIAKQNEIEYVYITTNGVLLNEEKIKKIIESGLDSIKFSIDSASKETYEKIRVGAKWEDLIKNITLLRKIRDETNSKLKIFASFTITHDNYSELNKYTSVFKNLIDETLFSFVYNQGGQVNTDTMIPRVVRENLDGLRLTRDKWHPCNLLWNRFIVNYDGKLTICCVDFDGKLIYGDLNKNSLRECWNNEKIQEFRRIHKTGKFELLPECMSCEVIKTSEEARGKLLSEISEMFKEKSEK